MNRLLQGDVGSGKTIVALMAALVAMENGFQVAFMAPTEILAEQHFITIRKLLEALAVPDRAADGRDAREEAARDAGGARRRVDAPGGRHARAGRGPGRLPRARSGRHRRAASLRRAAARDAARQGHAPRRAGDDGDADPAHAGADDLRRPRRVGHARDAAGTASRSRPSPSPSRAATRSTISSARQIDDGPAGVRHLSAGRGVGEGRSQGRDGDGRPSRRRNLPGSIASRCCTAA